MVLKQQKGVVHRAKAITLEELSVHFHEPINEVAKKLGVCVTVLKQRCREHGIARWPYRKVRKLDSIIRALQSSCQPEAPKASPGGKCREQKINIMMETREFLLLNSAHLGRLAPPCLQPSDATCPLSDVTSNQDGDSGGPGTGSISPVDGCGSEIVLHRGGEALAVSGAVEGRSGAAPPWDAYEVAVDSEVDASSLEMHSSLTESEATHRGKRARCEWRQQAILQQPLPQQQQVHVLLLPAQQQGAALPPPKFSSAKERHVQAAPGEGALMVHGRCDGKREEDCNFDRAGGGGSSTEQDEGLGLGGGLAERDLLEQFEIRDMESRHGSNFAFDALQGQRELPPPAVGLPPPPPRRHKSRKEPPPRDGLSAGVLGGVATAGAADGGPLPFSGRSAFRPLRSTGRAFGALGTVAAAGNRPAPEVPHLAAMSSGAHVSLRPAVAPGWLQGGLQGSSSSELGASIPAAGGMHTLPDHPSSLPSSAFTRAPRTAGEEATVCCSFDLSLCIDQSLGSAVAADGAHWGGGKSAGAGVEASAESQPPSAAMWRPPSPCAGLPSPTRAPLLPGGEVEASPRTSAEFCSLSVFRPKPLSYHYPDAGGAPSRALPVRGPPAGSGTAPPPPSVFFFPVTSRLFAGGNGAADA